MRPYTMFDNNAKQIQRQFITTTGYCNSRRELFVRSKYQTL